MAQVRRDNDKFQLGGPKDTDLEGIDEKYSVFTDEDKLAAAQKDFPASEGYTWFASYTIKEDGKDVEELPHDYTIKFDRPGRADSKLYYYLQGKGGNKGSIHEIGFEATANKGNKQRVKAYLRIGDPPIGTYP